MLGLTALAAACSQQPSSGGNASQSGSGPPAGAAELPTVKAGYWERTVSQDGGQPQVSHVCDTGEALKLDGIDRNCSQFAISRTSAGAIEVNATCAAGPVTSTLHETFSGDFNASYAADSQISIAMQGQPPRNISSHVAMRYVGACPPQPPPAGPSDAG
jgi:hypothetical protein